jgi:hypothetical protein
VLIAEGLWPNSAFPDGRGINTLTGADAVAPYGGAAFHDNRVAMERVPQSVIPGRPEGSSPEPTTGCTPVSNVAFDRGFRVLAARAPE